MYSCNMHEYTQNYFQNDECKILTHTTPQLMPFRNLIAALYSLLPLRLIFLLESKTTQSINNFLQVHKATHHCHQLKLRWNFSDEAFTRTAGHASVVYLSKTAKRVSSIISFRCGCFIGLKLQFWNESYMWPISEPALQCIAFPVL